MSGGEVQRSRRRGLVLGAGGALGASWMLGTLSALQTEEALDPRSFDVIVGTSAGSVLGALFASGSAVDDLVERIVEADEPRVEGTGPVNPFDVHQSLARIPRPVLLPGNLTLATRTAFRSPRLMTFVAGLAPRGRGDLAPVADLIVAALAGRGWPATPRLWVVAMDFDSGRRVVFGRDGDDVPLPSAVTASCAAPGYFPPVAIAGRRYVDGGAVSMTNADLLADAGLDEIVVLAPMAGRAQRRRRWTPAEQADRRLRQHFTRRLSVEVRRLVAHGAAVRVFAPSEEDLSAMGYNMMNPARRREVLLTAQSTWRARLGDRATA